MKKILVTGGAGYVGSVLIPKLLEKQYQVRVIDLMIYGKEHLPIHPQLETIEGDIRNPSLMEKAMHQIDAVIHLACISNDPSFDLNPELGKSINLDAFEPMVQLARANGVGRFIYASSSSVYGIKSEPNVHEAMPLDPLTDYSKYKAECETILSRYNSDQFCTVSIRPATVCGFGPRQRLDVVVNILTNLAYHTGQIKVFGGNQKRPNIHIEDMTDLYLQLLEEPNENISNQVFNVGHENHTVNQLAEIVKEKVGPDTEVLRTESDDNRSYHISSEKIKTHLGFQTKHSIESAVSGLIKAFDEKRLIDPINNTLYYNIKTMQKINLT